MPWGPFRSVLLLLLLLAAAALAGCSDDALPRPEVSAHGTWTFGIGKSL